MDRCALSPRTVDLMDRVCTINTHDRPGGFYDDLGELDAQHYVSNVPEETGDQAVTPQVFKSHVFYIDNAF